MVFELLIVIIALIWIITATIFDVKTKEVPDWLNFSLIIIAIFIHLLYSLYNLTYTNLIFPLMGFVVYFIFGNLMYVLKQWGGGDAKLLIGLGILIPIYPEFLLNYFNPNLNIPFLAIFLINTLIIGGIYGIILAIYYSIKNRKQFIKNFKVLFKKNKKFLKLVLVLFIISLGVSLLLIKELRIVGYLFSSFILVIPYLFIFIKAVENSSMYRKISISKLKEGDWIPQDIKIKKKIVYKSNFSGVTKRDIAKLKKYKIKNIIIKEGFAFVPAFLIGFIVSLLFGNLIRI